MKTSKQITVSPTYSFNVDAQKSKIPNGFSIAIGNFSVLVQLLPVVSPKSSSADHIEHQQANLVHGADDRVIQEGHHLGQNLLGKVAVNSLASSKLLLNQAKFVDLELFKYLHTLLGHVNVGRVFALEVLVLWQVRELVFHVAKRRDLVLFASERFVFRHKLVEL